MCPNTPVARPSLPTGYGYQHGHLIAAVVKCAKGQPGQPYDRATLEGLSRSAHTLELDLSAFQDDERVSPFGFVVGVFLARRYVDLAGFETGREASAEKREAVASGLTHAAYRGW